MDTDDAYDAVRCADDDVLALQNLNGATARGSLMSQQGACSSAPCLGEGLQSTSGKASCAHRGRGISSMKSWDPSGKQAFAQCHLTLCYHPHGTGQGWNGATGIEAVQRGPSGVRINQTSSGTAIARWLGTWRRSRNARIMGIDYTTSRTRLPDGA